MSDSLRNISESYLAIRDELLNTIDEETGEVNAEVLERLNSMQESLLVKAQNVALVCLELRDRKEAIKREIERLQSLLKRAESGEEWLKGYLSETMSSTGYERIEGVFTKISFRSSEETVIDNMDELPKEFIKEKVTYTPDKTAIKVAIKSGQQVNGAHLEKKKNLQIK